MKRLRQLRSGERLGQVEQAVEAALLVAVEEARPVAVALVVGEQREVQHPVGDAVVSEVVLRDGVPQCGLACRGGSPLLVAVVRTKPARSGA